MLKEEPSETRPIFECIQTIYLSLKKAASLHDAYFIAGPNPGRDERHRRRLFVAVEPRVVAADHVAAALQPSGKLVVRSIYLSLLFTRGDSNP